MFSIDKNSFFWRYLSDSQRGLINLGIYLLEDITNHPDVRITDYSYLVFPFSKAYEGFLKKLFLDLGFINYKEYNSDHFRIGKALNPSLEKRLRKWSIYDKIVARSKSVELAQELWSVWKEGRNQVFHYFPHNLRSLELEAAERIIERMLRVMERALTECRVKVN